jgi:peptidoglycan/LPS O-acetylase OafA/YrhL
MNLNWNRFLYFASTVLQRAVMSYYPVPAIVIGAIATYLIATVVGGAIVKAGFKLPSEERRIGCVDGLRGYLALSVAIHHFIFWLQFTRLGGGWSQLRVNIFSSLGNGAVALFFMITGLVFYPRVLAGFRKTSWLATYTTRIFRLLPLAIFSVAVVTLIIIFRTGRGLDGAFPAAAAKWVTGWSEPPLLGYDDSGRLNFYVLWSLWYEWLFYIFVLPACALGTDIIGDRLPSWVLPATLLLVTIPLRHWVGGLVTYLPLFTIGMLAFECRRRGTMQEFFQARWVAILAVASLLVGMASAPTPYSYAQLPFYGFFFIAVACGNDLFGMLRTKGSLLLGECSYGIYLLHGIVLSLLFVEGVSIIGDFSTNQLPALLPAVALIVVCITCGTYIFIERSAIRKGASIARRLSGRRARVEDPQLEVAP